MTVLSKSAMMWNVSLLYTKDHLYTLYFAQNVLFIENHAQCDDTCGIKKKQIFFSCKYKLYFTRNVHFIENHAQYDETCEITTAAVFFACIYTFYIARISHFIENFAQCDDTCEIIAKRKSSFRAGMTSGIITVRPAQLCCRKQKFFLWTMWAFVARRGDHNSVKGKRGEQKKVPVLAWWWRRELFVQRPKVFIWEKYLKLQKL